MRARHKVTHRPQGPTDACDMLLEPEPGPASLGAPRAQGTRLRLGGPGVMQGTEAARQMTGLPHPVSGRRRGWDCLNRGGLWPSAALGRRGFLGRGRVPLAWLGSDKASDLGLPGRTDPGHSSSHSGSPGGQDPATWVPAGRLPCLPAHSPSASCTPRGPGGRGRGAACWEPWLQIQMLLRSRPCG